MGEYFNRATYAQKQPRTLAGWNSIPLSVTLHWEGTQVSSDSHESAIKTMRGIESYHMGLKNKDGSNTYQYIAYNFAVAANGDIFECRGADKKSGANGSTKANNESVAICYLGGPEQPFTQAAKDSIIELIGSLQSQGKLKNPAPVYPHSKWTGTACPGPVIKEFAAQISGGQIPLPTAPAAPKPPAKPPAKPAGKTTPKFPLPQGHYYSQPDTDRNSPGYIQCHSGKWNPNDRPTIKLIQQALGMKTQDGIIDTGGPTYKAIRAYQQSRGLRVDGKVGEITFPRLMKDRGILI